MKYAAKTDYLSEQSARTYEQRLMYQGILGWRRVKIETKIIATLAGEIAPGSTILDCPCGNGRWFSFLATNATGIIGVDISNGMVDVARLRAGETPCNLEVRRGDAENLGLGDNAVDYVFSYALMKHLPLPIQYRVLSEFGRVCSRRVICSFAVLDPLSYAWWRRRRPPESYPIVREELDTMSEAAGLRLEGLIKVSQPLVGLEHFAVFEKTR